MNCPRCNTPNPDGHRFCSNCGAPLPSTQSQNTYSQNQQTGQYGYGTYQQPMNVQQSQPKQPLWKRTWFIVLVCIIFPPAGIALLWAAKKPSEQGGRIALTVVLAFWTIALGVYGMEQDEVENKEASVDKSSIEQSFEEQALENEEDLADSTNDIGAGFVFEFGKEVGNGLAENVYYVLTNEVGFSDINYEKRIEETSNYEIKADGTLMMMTAMDDYLRVWIPNTSYVFYEDGAVLMTKDEFERKTIDQYEKDIYYIMAQDIVCSFLKSPSSADFPSVITHSEEISMATDGYIIAVQSYVESKNDFGVKVRTDWVVEFTVLDEEMYSYELVYANVGGQEVGAFVNIE